MFGYIHLAWEQRLGQESIKTTNIVDIFPGQNMLYECLSYGGYGGHC